MKQSQLPTLSFPFFSVFWLCGIQLLDQRDLTEILFRGVFKNKQASFQVLNTAPLLPIPHALHLTLSDTVDLVSQAFLQRARSLSLQPRKLSCSAGTAAASYNKTGQFLSVIAVVAYSSDPSVCWSSCLFTVADSAQEGGGQPLRSQATSRSASPFFLEDASRPLEF